MKKNIFAKITAVIALFAIIMSIIGTGILLIYESLNLSTEKQEFSQDELQKLLKQYSSGNTLSGNLTNSGVLQVETGTLINTGITK